jgi:DNA-binding beta-propeller fold protein YncE
MVPAVVIALSVLAWAGLAPAVTIPPPQRMPSQVTATLAAPAGNEMDMPTDVAVDAAGRIYIADGVKGRVVALNADGTFAGAIESAGDVRLVRPVGLTVDAQDRLWIADTRLHRVLAVAASGEGWPARTTLLMDLTPPSMRREQTLVAAGPTDMAVTADGSQVFMVDGAHHRLIAYDMQTRAMQVIGGLGRGLGEFEFPFQISTGPGGFLFVSEAIGGRVQRITPAGRPSGQIGRWGVEVGQLYRPKGIAVSEAGFVYASDSSLGVVQVFRTDGSLVGVLTDPQGTPLSFKHPMGMTLDAQGRLLVVELAANRVAVVTIAGPAPAARPTATPPTGRRGTR